MSSDLRREVEQIARVWQSLHSAWVTARQSWKDKDRDQFDREHIQEFGDATNTYIANLQRLAETVQQIRKNAP